MKNRRFKKRFIAAAIVFGVNQTALCGNVFFDTQIVTEAATYQYDQDFEAALTEQGFPESYKAALRALHAQHPNWVFQAFQTGLEWSTVIENEMTFRRNLVPDTSTYPSAYKDTTISGSYDWVNSQWMVLSDPYWVQASQAAVEYYMDPRNFLTEEYMFQFELETFNKDVQNLEGVEKILEGTFMSNTLVDGTSEVEDNAYITSDTYSANSVYLTGVQTKTTVKRLLLSLHSEAGDVRVVSADGTAKKLTDYVGTGDLIQVVTTGSTGETAESQKQETETITACQVLLYGDIDGNGQIDALDRAYLKAYVYGTLKLSDLQLAAADVNQDGDVNAVDRAYLKASVYGTLSINQFEKDEGVTYGELFMQIGEELNVSPYTLASRVRQEQGSGTSQLISGTVPGYEGYYNYFNIKASGTTRDEIIKNGMEEAKANGWDSRYKAIVGGATTLCEGHIWKGQDTLYLQKFDVEGEYYGYYWHQYMQNLLAACSEGYSVYKAYKNMDALDENFVFKIPVYENMPSTACAKPTQDGNPNYKLKSLSVKYYSINFKRDVYDYYIDVPRSVKTLTVSAEAYASTTKVTGTGAITINASTSVVTIKTQAENGDTKEYRIHLRRT
jgi:beta-N-acetylglucosaminidase